MYLYHYTSNREQELFLIAIFLFSPEGVHCLLLLSRDMLSRKVQEKKKTKEEEEEEDSGAGDIYKQ